VSRLGLEGPQRVEKEQLVQYVDEVQASGEDSEELGTAPKDNDTNAKDTMKHYILLLEFKSDFLVH